ncbi:hypothetical protein COLO4_35585 [Corchorus olitorius]|uniref:Uncharacterized protein n=1 Tax=Corchorus olitorius TaxID=93759 RepID=A0A1R3GF37_9ROSI|nr:hypothetical protein COLO4_35585 [Corchorus olitorius]
MKDRGRRLEQLLLDSSSTRDPKGNEQQRRQFGIQRKSKSERLDCVYGGRGVERAAMLDVEKVY